MGRNTNLTGSMPSTRNLYIRRKDIYTMYICIFYLSCRITNFIDQSIITRQKINKKRVTLKKVI